MSQWHHQIVALTTYHCMFFITADECWCCPYTSIDKYWVLGITKNDLLEHILFPKLSKWVICMTKVNNTLTSQWLMIRVDFSFINHIICYNRLINNYCVLWITKIGQLEAAVHKMYFGGFSVTVISEYCAVYVLLYGLCHWWWMLMLFIYKHRQVLCIWNHKN